MIRERRTFLVGCKLNYIYACTEKSCDFSKQITPCWSPITTSWSRPFTGLICCAYKPTWSSYFATYVGPFGSEFTNDIMLFHPYRLYGDTLLSNSVITLQLRPFTVIAGSTQLDAISVCREPGSACLASILNFYSYYTKMALGMFFFHLADTRHVQKNILFIWRPSLMR